MDNDTVADFFTADRPLPVTKNALVLSGGFIFTTALRTPRSVSVTVTAERTCSAGTGVS
ncbi:hypothetical protein [Streptomyces shenzhenensis]|uniref:hypothetical protein n=1 Tax=Streptomyces shenzhenensis TaxID=943815 RepID=UPI0015F07A38|nr:hypothetical protein [Streptomyces shenzhenensis]